jgi:hypothetical protein
MIPVRSRDLLGRSLAISPPSPAAGVVTTERGPSMKGKSRRSVKDLPQPTDRLPLGTQFRARSGTHQLRSPLCQKRFGEKLRPG